MSNKIIAQKIWDVLHTITRTDHWETENPYSERPCRNSLSYYILDDKEKSLEAIEQILSENLS